MFAFNASGSSTSSQGRSSQDPSTKSKYVPSIYIAKQLALEEENRRAGSSRGHRDSTPWAPQSDSSQEHWPGPEQVLAPGYSSGPLGYDAQPPSSHSIFVSAQSSTEPVQHAKTSSTLGAGVGSGSDPSEARTLPNGRSATSSEAFPSSASKGISRNGRPELSKDDINGRNGPVRFSTMAPELNTPLASTPSIFNQGGGSSAFFSTGHLSNSNSGISNLKSALREAKVDVLTHKAAAAASALNSSLGPALGSVSGTSQQAQVLGSPKLQGDVGSAAKRTNGMPNTSASAIGSSFYLSLDATGMRQPGKPISPLNKGYVDGDDKDNERYMPSILLSTASGSKVKGMEPFVDGASGKPGWDSDPFQQTGPRKEGGSRLAPHLIGEDAPPIDTLYDIAHKEKYYVRPTLTPSPFSVPNPDTRPDTEMGQGGEGSKTKADDDIYESIITYGFPPEMASHMLNEFRAFGRVIKYETGFYGRVSSESFNWLKIEYERTWAARNAVSRHLKAVGKYVVGVTPCRSFSARPSSSAASMDTSADGEQGSGLTQVEARQVQMGVGALLTLRSQGVGPDVSLSQSRTSALARHASLYDAWNQGGTPLESPIPTPLDDDTAPAPGRPSVEDQEDEDMAYILGHSLTSCGSLARSRQGRRSEREQADPLRSRSKDTNLGQDQDIKRNGADGGILSEPKSMDTTSIGFRPLFDDDPEKYFSGSAFGQGFDKGNRHQDETLRRSQQQQQQQQQQPSSSSQQQQSSQYLSTSRLSLRRPPLDASSHSDTTLFASSQGLLIDTGADSDPTSLYPTQKRQRLSSSLFAPRSSAPAAVGPSNNDHVPLNMFGVGRGRDRSSLLVDDPSLVDQWGVPLQRAASTPATGTPGTAARGGGAGANGQAEGSDSVLSTMFNMAKKRLFWG